MMLDTLSDYIDAARQRQELRSDRALARLMEVPQPYVSDWRTGKEWPGDTLMRRLAQLAGADEEQALVLLNVWRAKDEPTRETYRRLLRRVGGGTGLAVAVAASLAVGGAPEQGRGWSFSQLVAALIDNYGNWRRISRRVAVALGFPARAAAIVAPLLVAACAPGGASSPLDPPLSYHADRQPSPPMRPVR